MSGAEQAGLLASSQRTSLCLDRIHCRGCRCTDDSYALWELVWKISWVFKKHHSDMDQTQKTRLERFLGTELSREMDEVVNTQQYPGSNSLFFGMKSEFKSSLGLENWRALQEFIDANPSYCPRVRDSKMPDINTFVVAERKNFQETRFEAADSTSVSMRQYTVSRVICKISYSAYDTLIRVQRNGGKPFSCSCCILL